MYQETTWNSGPGFFAEQRQRVIDIAKAVTCFSKLFTELDMHKPCPVLLLQQPASLQPADRGLQKKRLARSCFSPLVSSLVHFTQAIMGNISGPSRHTSHAVFMQPRGSLAPAELIASDCRCCTCHQPMTDR